MLGEKRSDMRTTLTGPYGRAHITEARSGDYYVHVEDKQNGWGRRHGIYPTQRDAFHAARAYIMGGVK